MEAEEDNAGKSLVGYFVLDYFGRRLERGKNVAIHVSKAWWRKEIRKDLFYSRCALLIYYNHFGLKQHWN